MILLMEVLDRYDEVGCPGYNSYPSYLVSASLDTWDIFCPMAYELLEYQRQSLVEMWWSMVAVAILHVAHVFAMMVVVWLLVFGSREVDGSREVELFDKIRVPLLSGGFGCICRGRDLVSRRRDLCTWCGEVQMEKVKYF
jgi:hypothetical protein